MHRGVRHGDGLQGLGSPAAFLREERIRAGERALRRRLRSRAPVGRGPTGCSPARLGSVQGCTCTGRRQTRCHLECVCGVGGAGAALCGPSVQEAACAEGSLTDSRPRDLPSEP